MDDMNFLTRAEHEEFEKRMSTENSRLKDENDRQNKRLDSLEETVKKIGDLTLSVDRMANTMQKMVEEQAKQGKRLEQIEKEPADNWKKMSWEIMKYVIVAALAIVAAKVGLVV